MDNIDDRVTEGEVFEIDDSNFECKVCEETIEFEFDEQQGGLDLENVPEDMHEEMEGMPGDVEPPGMNPSFEDQFEETDIKVVCDCGAEYIVKKLPGVPGFEVTHILEEGPEVPQEFNEEGPIE